MRSTGHTKQRENTEWGGTEREHRAEGGQRAGWGRTGRRHRTEEWGHRVEKRTQNRGGGHKAEKETQNRGGTQSRCPSESGDCVIISCPLEMFSFLIYR